MSTSVGYTGGTNPNPTYGSVCDGDGHTEAIKIEYDPDKTTYKDLLDVFWKQYRGSSESVQYKSAIWYHSDEQKRAIEASLEAIAARKGKVPDVDVLPARSWHDAEGYHQKYNKRRRWIIGGLLIPYIWAINQSVGDWIDGGKANSEDCCGQ